MSYAINPHQHVKIWLSENRSSFLNDLNQLRLVRMREQNKADRITLVIDSRLLNANAMAAAEKFCQANRIELVDVTSLTPTDAEESELFNLYNREIKALGQGGNLGQASDYLRWVREIFSRGIYSDFDVEVNTSGVDATISSSQPILMPIGTISISSQADAYKAGLTPELYAKLKENTNETIAMNNDTIAIASDIEPSNANLKSIQRNIISLNQPFTDSWSGNPYQLMIQSMRESAEKKVGMEYLQSLQASSSDIQGATAIQTMCEAGMTPTTLRAQIKMAMDTQRSYMTISSTQLIRTELQELKQQLLETAKSSEHPKIYYHIIRGIDKKLAMSGAELIDTILTEQSEALIKASVICTSGPFAISLALFAEQILGIDEVRETLEPCTLAANGLGEAFQSANSVKLHNSAIDFANDLADEELHGDVSWTDSGQSKIKKAEASMHEAVTKVEAAARGYLSRKSIFTKKAKLTPAKEAEEQTPEEAPKAKNDPRMGS